MGRSSSRLFQTPWELSVLPTVRHRIHRYPFFKWKKTCISPKPKEIFKNATFPSILNQYITIYLVLRLCIFIVTMWLTGYKSSLLSITIGYIPDNFHNSIQIQSTECFCPEDYKAHTKKEQNRQQATRL